MSAGGGPFTPHESAMSNMMGDDEAPPAYSPNTFATSMSEWYPTTGSAQFPGSRDYAEIMTFPPPPVSPPLLPPGMMHNTVPVSRDYSPTNHNTQSRGVTPTNHTVPVSRDFMAPSQDQYSHCHQHEQGLIGDYSTKLNVSSAI